MVCGEFVLAPTLPFFAMGKGATAVDWAMITSGFSLCQLVGSPLLGMLSDRVGRRPVLLAELAAASVLYFLLGTVQSVNMLLLVRVALGFTVGASAAGTACIIELTEGKKEDRPFWLGLQKTLQAAGTIIGPALGGIIAPFSKRALNEKVTFTHCCKVVSGVCALNFVIGFIFFTEPKSLRFNHPKSAAIKEAATGDNFNDRSEPFVSFLRRRFNGPLRLLVAGFLDCFAMAVSDGPEAYFLKDTFNFGPRSLSGFFMVCAASTLVWANAVPYVTKRLGAKNACVYFSLASGTVMLTLLVFRFWWAPYLYAFLIGCTVTIVEVISHTTLLCGIVAESQQGAVYGMQSALINLGFVLGPPLGGAIYQWTGKGVPYCVSFVTFCLSALIYSSLPCEESQSESLLGDGLRSSTTPRALQHMAHEQGLANKRGTARLCTERKQKYRTFFVDHALYDEFVDSQAGVKRSHSIGIESMSKMLSNKGVFAPEVLPRTISAHTLEPIPGGADRPFLLQA